MTRSAELYLQHDLSNRLMLSLRSGIPTEVDFALERLVQVSSVEPAFLPFAGLPSLASDLLLVLTDAVHSLDTGSRDRDRLRRGIEAAIVMRNIALESADHRTALARGSRLADLAARTLRRGLPDADAVCAGDLSNAPLGATDAYGGSDELRLTMLDLLECVVVASPPIMACFPPVAGTSQAVNDLIAQHAPPDDPRRQLYALTVAYAVRSPDRAVMLAAFRVLAAMYSTPPMLSEPLLSHALAGLAVERALELVPLFDADVAQAVLEHIYLYSTLPDNAVRLAARSDIHHDVRALTAIVRRFGMREEIECDIAVPLRSSTEPAANRGPMRLSDAEAVQISLLQPRDAAMNWCAEWHPRSV